MLRFFLEALFVFGGGFAVAYFYSWLVVWAAKNNHDFLFLFLLGVLGGAMIGVGIGFFLLWLL